MAKKSLEERIQRLEDIHEIHNLMGRYQYFISGGKGVETVDQLFAKKTPGVSVDEGRGVYEGLESVRALVAEFDKMFHQPGHLSEHPITTPVIEVAGDGKTAKGIWISPGHETASMGGDKLTGHWVWLKYAMDFVKEDGEWKIWHWKVYVTFFTPYDTSWVDFEVPILNELSGGSWPEPDRPSSYYKPYSRTDIAQYIPVPPEPYETFEE